MFAVITQFTADVKRSISGGSATIPGKATGIWIRPPSAPAPHVQTFDVTPEQANATQAAAASVGLANAAENSSSPTADGKTKVVVPEPDQPHNTKDDVLIHPVRAW